MPRITYKTRFEELLSKDYITRYDREFIESLFRYYSTYRKLTSGRREHFLRLEKKYESRPSVSSEQKEQLTIISELVDKSHILQDDRGREILLDFSLQITCGKPLSNKQIEIINEKIDMYSQKNIDMAKNWANSWDSEKQTRFRVSVDYYKTTGNYFKNTVAKVRRDPDYLPTFKEYNAIANNTYSRKIIDGYLKKPKFEVGSQVTKSSNWANSGRNSIRYLFSKAAWDRPKGDIYVVLQAQPVSPRSPCRGNKIYKIMDISTGAIYGAEERELKLLKKNSTKRKK